MYNNASELYNEYLEIYFDGYKTVSDAKKELGDKYNPVNLFREAYNYDHWSENEESTDATRKSDKKESADLSNMPLLEDDEEDVKEEKRIKIFNSKQIAN